MRHALPAAHLGRHGNHRGQGNLPSYSFAKAQNKRAWSGLGGRTWGDGIGWTTTAEDRAAIPPTITTTSSMPTDVPTPTFRPLTFSRRAARYTRGQGRSTFVVLRRRRLHDDAESLEKQGEKITFAVGPWKDDNVAKIHMFDGVSQATDGMVRGMKVGGWRRARMNQVVAKPREVLPGMKAREVICIEVHLLTVALVRR